MDIKVRCHSCAKETEIDADPDFIIENMYAIPPTEFVLCAHCGKEHSHGDEMPIREDLVKYAFLVREDLPVLVERVPVCKWLLDDDTGSYDTDCGQKFLLDEGTPAENNFKFCPFCGKHLCDCLGRGKANGLNNRSRDFNCTLAL